MRNANHMPFAVAMLLALFVAVAHKYGPKEDTVMVEMPDGNQVVASEVFCENSHFVVEVGNEKIAVPKGYTLTRNDQDHARFIRTQN